MIDVAAFVGPWPWRPGGMSAPALAAHLADHGITRALVTPMEGIFWDDPQPANENLAEATGTLPLTLVPALDPTFPSWRRDLERCLDAHGTRAVRIFPGYRGFPVDASAVLELLEAAGSRGITVFVQLRMQDARMQNRFAQYPDVAAAAALGVASLFPGTRIVLGGARLGELEAARSQLGRLENVFVETSGIERVGGMHVLLDMVGAGRILLGTHAPLFLVRAALLKLEEAELDENEAKAIKEGNARRLFGL